MLPKSVTFIKTNFQRKEGKRPLGRPRHRGDDNIRWIFRK
jgi:hypothetical protein